jgi:hypothetical protein
LSEGKGNNRLVKIGGGLIILAAFGIMLPAIFQYVAGLARMVILIVVALAAAYLLNLMMARQAVNRMRQKAEAAQAAAHANGEDSTSEGEGNNGGGDGSHDDADEKS